MLGFGTHTKSVTYGAIIDVGSGTVGVGIVKSDYNKKLPEVIFSHRIEMRIADADTNTPEDQMRRMREALFSASLILSKDGLTALHSLNPHAKISRILVTCASPWAYTISKNVDYVHDSSLKITPAFIHDLEQSAEDEIAKGMEVFEESGSSDLKVVERATVDLKVNGYSVNDPVGLYGHEFSLSHIAGLVPKEVLDAVHEVQEKILTDTKISAHTYMLVIYCVLRDLFPKTDSLTIIDVTGESTEIGIVENGVLLESIHSRCGSNTLVREISEKTKGSHQDTISSLQALAENTSSPQSIEALKLHLETYTQDLTHTIESIHKNMNIPTTVVVTAQPAMRALFSTLAKDVLSNITQTTPTVLELDTKILDEVALRNNQDIFIAIASRFFHKLHGCGEIETL